MTNVTVPAKGCGPEADQISTFPALPVVLYDLSVMPVLVKPGMVEVTVTLRSDETLLFRKTWTSPAEHVAEDVMPPELALTAVTRVMVRMSANVSPMDRALRWIPRDISATSEM